MATLICGSFAYDTIMVFPDSFKNHIIPEQVHILNVCFMVPEMRREFGGCAGNIAYNLRLLGGDAVPMGTVGHDFAPYRDWIRSHGIRDTHVTELPDTYTAQAFITTDMDDNQIIAFHPGAMSQAHHNRVSSAEGIELGIVAPDGRDAMIQHAGDFSEAGIPFVFDPGQGLPMFDGDDLDQFIDRASWVIVNDYESKVLQEKTGKSLNAIAARVNALIVTMGAQGSLVHAGGETIEVPPVAADAAVDPTGCGDAYRGGLLYGIAQQFDWPTTGRIASLLGSIKIERHGTQNHSVTTDEFDARFREEFGYTFR
ncbi:MAG: carbohydrate kinase family protein [Proteobacteria bacterium]|nr:MAG: carbohydrate kinase family protein [Pseudomonadota bacterium]